MKKILKNLIFVSCMMVVLASSFSTFATNVNQNNETKNANIREEKDAEMVLGKITNISADSMTIELANRVKREKKTAEERKAEKDQANQTERTKPSVEDKFTLTGESKTYNTTSADFGRKAPKNESAENTDEKVKGEKMTYTDYKVGDYVRITVGKDTPTVAKRVRMADQGFDYKGTKKGNYQGGYKGSYTGKTKTEKVADIKEAIQEKQEQK